jgi:hypothetical protein
MAGGLFGKPFKINIKCVIFSLICMGLFLHKPEFKSNTSLYIALGLIFVIAYVAMAWYDFFFDCQIAPLDRGSFSFTGLFKPSHSDNNDEKDEEKQKREISRKAYLIYFSHILFFAPLIAYVGFYKNKVNPNVYPILVVLAIFTLFYHAGHLI